MRMRDSAEAFRSFLGSRDLDISDVSVVAAVNAWIDFYKAQSFDDVTEGLDWLWFQFGTSAPTTGATVRHSRLI